ncbi:hypothetical protein DPMN_110046 [Dreissena polymorpha]|uniref:Uncharacterized protein n=1 Tax=Dreissena polymorpha TaxID=45954 RepID=A0A9D4KBC8_DREPO|nr:hypothetical protein DPMN_110046 [Dreissena polymorpha]
MPRCLLPSPTMLLKPLSTHAPLSLCSEILPSYLSRRNQQENAFGSMDDRTRCSPKRASSDDVERPLFTHWPSVFRLALRVTLAPVAPTDD